MAPLRTLLLGAWLASAATAAAAPPLEYQVKAVFLLRFAQFVEWPRDAFDSSSTPLVIGVLGNDPFGDYLDEIVRGETVDGRPLVVRRFEDIEEGARSHVLFVSRSEAERLPQITRALGTKPVLLVGEADRFASQGGMIGFVMQNNRIRFSINPDAAKAARLTLSSKLLRSATIVDPGEA